MTTTPTESDDEPPEPTPTQETAATDVAPPVTQLALSTLRTTRSTAALRDAATPPSFLQLVGTVDVAKMAATRAQLSVGAASLSATKAALDSIHSATAARILAVDGTSVSAALSAANALRVAGLNPSGPLASAVRASEAAQKAYRAFCDTTQGALATGSMLKVADGQFLGLGQTRSFISDATITQLMSTPSPMADRILSMAQQAHATTPWTLLPGASAALKRVMEETGLGLGAAAARWQRHWLLSDAVQLHTSAVITKVMRQYTRLADIGDLGARLALQLALHVRDAILEHAVDATELVELFLRNFLGFDIVSYELIASAMLAITNVAAWLPADGVPDNFDPRKKLRSLTLSENRRSDRLLIDPTASQANYRSIASLNAPLTTNPDITLLDVLPATATTGDDEFADPRLRAVDDKLTARERRLLRERGHERNWLDAAVACGEDPSVGEQLRRKTRRYGSLIDPAATSTDGTSPTSASSAPAPGKARA